MGTDVYYEQNGTGKDILMLHGWGCSAAHFAPIAKELALSARVTVPDFPGHGHSGRPPEPWGVAEYAACVLELMDSLNLRTCDIIAHSFGGRVALYLASHHPERVGKMVLTGCAGLKKEATPEQKKRQAAYKNKKAFLEKLRKVPLAGQFADRALTALRKKYGSADYNALDDEMKKTFVKVVNQDLRPLLPDIHASTLLIWGQNDDATPLWMGQVMEKEIPDAGLVVFEDDDHFAYLHQWQRFNQIVKTFLC